MSRGVLLRIGKQIAAAMAVLIVLLVCAEPSLAQNIYGISKILPSATTGTIDAFAATEADNYVAYYYPGWYVNAYLCQTTTQITTIYNGSCPAGSLIDLGTSANNQYYKDLQTGLYVSGGYLQDSYTVGDFYTLISWHYLEAYYIYGYGYYDPAGFSTSFVQNTDQSGTDYPGDCFLSCTPVYVTVAAILAGLTAYEISGTAPQITSITPGAVSVGSSGTSIVLDGTNLIDSFGDTPTVSISNSSGITYSVVPKSSTEIDLTNVNIATSATTGNHSVTVSTYFGTSNAITLNIGDPTPVVTGVNPSVWPAGSNNLSVTITGKGFGTNPSVSVSSTYVTVGTPSNVSDTSLQVNISVSSNAPNSTVTVQVQSNGYTGNGFLGTNNNSSTGSNTAQLQATPPPPPFFVMGTDSNGSLCTSGTPIQGTQQVVPGQQISITACIPQSARPGSSLSWNTPFSANSTTAIAAFSVGAGPSFTETLTQQIQPATCNANWYCDLPQFYWLANVQGTQTLSFSYVAANGQPGSGSVNFNINLPTGNLLLTANMKTDGSGVQVLSDTQTGTPELRMTGTSVQGGQVGISFTSNATAPAGSGTNQSFIWVQLLTNIQSQTLGSNGAGASPASSGLDKTYPYSNVTTTTTYDTPQLDLLPRYGEEWESFSATMYLMWDPALPSGCSPAKTVQNGTTFTSTQSTCTSIPVPLSSVTWHWSGCAIDTLAPQSNSTNWTLSTKNGCPVDTLGTVQLSDSASGFPQWTSVY